MLYLLEIICVAYMIKKENHGQKCRSFFEIVAYLHTWLKQNSTFICFESNSTLSTVVLSFILL